MKWKELWEDYKNIGSSEDNPVLRYIVRVANKTSNNALILDVGSGFSRYSYPLAKEGYKVCCIDIEEEILNKTQTLLNGKNIKMEVVRGDAFYLPFKHECFNFVFSEGLAEHFQDDKRQFFVNELSKISKNKVLIITHNAYSIPYRIGLFFFTLTKRYPYNYVQEFPYSPGELHELFKKAGFKRIYISIDWIPTKFWAYYSDGFLRKIIPDSILSLISKTLVGKFLGYKIFCLGIK